jgi:SPP1 family phage portal protein
MIYVNRNTELTTELLGKMINHFNIQVKPKLLQYKNYYDGLQDIMNKKYADPTKPCNKTVINYCLSVANAYGGFIATPGCISYSSKEDIEDVMDVLRYNDYQAEDSDFLMDALIYGVANELMYIDSDSQTRFRLISPLMSFGVFDDSLTEDLLYFVRMYKANQWGNDDIYNVDVYDSGSIKHFTMSGMNGGLNFVGEEPHYFSQCPANIFYMPDEKSVFDCILTLQDSVNELLSNEISDFSEFCDAYLVLKGVDADSDDIAAMKENRVLLVPADAEASYLTKNSIDTQVENILNRLHDSIYRVSACVDFSSEALMSGIASGLSVRYKMSGMETRAGKIEAEMKKALQRRIEIICGMSALKLGESVFRDIEISFKRNIPEDISATVNLINSLKGTVSDKTLLGQLDFVPDVNAEIEAIQEQKSNEMSLYNFMTEDDE